MSRSVGKKDENKVVTGIVLTEKTMEWLDKKAKEIGAPRSVVIEMIVKEKIKKGGDLRA